MRKVEQAPPESPPYLISQELGSAPKARLRIDPTRPIRQDGPPVVLSRTGEAMSAGTSEFSAQTGNSGYRDIRIFLWAFVLGWVAFLAFRSLTNRDHLLHVLPEMAVWVVVGAIVNLLPLQGWQSAPFAADDPMVLAVAILFTPVEAAMITFLAAFDPGELR